MNDNDIVRITLVRNVHIKNTHDNHLFPLQDIIEIENRGGYVRILDLIADKDITDITYFEVCESEKTKRKDIFVEYNDD